MCERKKKNEQTNAANRRMAKPVHYQPNGIDWQSCRWQAYGLAPNNHNTGSFISLDFNRNSLFNTISVCYMSTTSSSSSLRYTGSNWCFFFVASFIRRFCVLLFHFEISIVWIVLCVRERCHYDSHLNKSKVERPDIQTAVFWRLENSYYNRFRGYYRWFATECCCACALVLMSNNCYLRGAPPEIWNMSAWLEMIWNNIAFGVGSAKRKTCGFVSFRSRSLLFGLI